MTQKIPFELQAGESVLRDEIAVWIQGGLRNRMGRICLTNQRFIFVRQNPFLAPLFGLLGVLIERLLANWIGKVALDLSLREISSVEKTQFGLNKKVLLLHTAQGDLKFGLTKPYEEMEVALKQALGTK